MKFHRLLTALALGLASLAIIYCFILMDKLIKVESKLNETIVQVNNGVMISRDSMAQLGKETFDVKLKLAEFDSWIHLKNPDTDTVAQFLSFKQIPLIMVE